MYIIPRLLRFQLPKIKSCTTFLSCWDISIFCSGGRGYRYRRRRKWRGGERFVTRCEWGVDLGFPHVSSSDFGFSISIWGIQPKDLSTYSGVTFSYPKQMGKKNNCYNCWTPGCGVSSSRCNKIHGSEHTEEIHDIHNKLYNKSTLELWLILVDG